MFIKTDLVKFRQLSKLKSMKSAKVDVIEDGDFDFEKSARSQKENQKIVRQEPLSFLRRIMRDIEESFHDKYRYVTLSFYIYGLAGLMPWNFYITPENYWNDKLCKLEKSCYLSRENLSLKFCTIF